MNVKLRIPALLMVFSAALATSAIAQVQTGSILAKANDAQGAVVPGVAVTISSPVLVSGTMTSTTDAGGACRFPSLPPGTYSVKMELQGFQSVIRENIVVTVTGASPVIDTTNANVNVTLSQDLLQRTPNGRDIWSLMEYKVPGLVSQRPDVGGTAGGLQGAMVARGTTNGQNSQYLNGVNVGDPSAIGFAGYYYDYDAFEELQISTGAHDISMPTSGVFLNMTTKTGGDHWQGKAATTGKATPRRAATSTASWRRSASGPKPTPSTSCPTSRSTPAGRSSRTRSGFSDRSAIGASTSTCRRPFRRPCSTRRTSPPASAT
jgi:hypothetical protein